MSSLYSPKDIVQSGLCIGCGSCVAQSKQTETAMRFDDFGELKPQGPAAWYSERTKQFSNTCPFSPVAAKEDEIATTLYTGNPHEHAALGYYRSAWVGHANETDFRLNGSSGGLVSWVAAELLKQGLVDGVIHIVASGDPAADGRFFKYRVSRSLQEIHEGAKSRYYPIELSQVLDEIRNTPGRYAIIAIPCFTKAIHLLRRNNPLFKERIAYTLGLFCGHMKSTRFVESMAWQMNLDINDVARVEYRYKDVHRPANQYIAMLTLNDGQVKKKDWWNMADGDWGAGFFMNNACNFCDDVVAETADISFGDAWVEPYSSDGKGTNVVIIRSAEIEQLVVDGIAAQRLQLTPVDGDFVQQTQAAGLRQRREGLAYRLTWVALSVKPCKRVAPSSTIQTKQRKVIYRMRYYITWWSHRVFRTAKRLNMPKLYINWARLALSAYHGLAYHKGKWGEMIKRWRQLQPPRPPKGGVW